MHTTRHKMNLRKIRFLVSRGIELEGCGPPNPPASLGWPKAPPDNLSAKSIQKSHLDREQNKNVQKISPSEDLKTELEQTLFPNLSKSVENVNPLQWSPSITGVSLRAYKELPGSAAGRGYKCNPICCHISVPKRLSAQRAYSPRQN